MQGLGLIFCWRTFGGLVPGWARLALAGWVASFCLIPPAWAVAPPSSQLVPAGDALARLEFDSRSRPQEVANELARRLVPSNVPVAERLELLRMLGMLQNSLGQDEAADRSLAQVVALGASAPPPVRPLAQLTADCLQASRTVHEGSLARGEALLDANALLESDELPPALAVSCRIIRATIKENLGRFDDAVRAWQSALRVADKIGGWRRSQIRNSLAYTLYRAGERERATKLNEESKQLARETEDWLSLSDALSVESILLTGQGKDQQELETLTGAVDYARLAGAKSELALAQANLSDYYLQRGDFRQAYRLAQQALPQPGGPNYAEAEQLARINMGMALIGMRRKDEGLALVRRVVADLKRSNAAVSLVETLEELGRTLEEAGYLAEAMSVYQELREASQAASMLHQQRALAELQESFEADARRVERALLNDDNQLKAEALRQSVLRFRQWALALGVAGMALLLLLLGHLRMRVVQKALRRKHESLALHSEQDPLTGLSNRRLLQRYFAEKTPDGMAAGQLFLLDLDHFKIINDTHGHAAGDAVLVEVARRLRTVVREQDVVVRWGGEEFLVLVPEGQALTEQAEPLARRMLAALAALPVLAGQVHIEVSGSIGFAAFPLQRGGPEPAAAAGAAPWALPWQTALDLVDSAMYIAKTQGRNRAVGMVRLPGADLAALEHLMQDLEGAWRDGLIRLAEIQGPPLERRPA